MISYRTYLLFEFETKETVKNITEHIKMFLEESKIKDGIIVISSLNTTSAVFINDDEEGLIRDTRELLEQLVPSYKDREYYHNKIEKDAIAHLKRNLLGRSVTISVTEGRMDLGNWEQILYADFDGKRKKKICIKMMGE